jgi:hypothetical protein
MQINYRIISLRHNLSRKCRKIVTFVSITHSKRNIWNGPIVARAIGNVTQDMLERAWRELEYRLDICRFTRGAHIECIKVSKKLQTFLFQMVVPSCISVQYLWKHGFTKSSDNLYASCIFICESNLFPKYSILCSVTARLPPPPQHVTPTKLTRLLFPGEKKLPFCSSF